ncbi:IucA/IucC family siderophore biosynthesis protein [Actinomadura logoneensis]|uniref:IucA/IucC family siderophore biosynthesis protein n=1 Tax=Actinomadura logoneensis TaxID=2293572 RepID=A0A372JIH4_9ACTN|nr:IucA/IucC family protein [Actinomadura logoneensis]RFU39606.1 IucA/IucC family siderophore biosynthesis protein [Actinomadura logoneensis]
MTLTRPAAPETTTDAAPACDAAATAADGTAVALLNCLVREVCGPERQLFPEDRRLVMRLPRVGVLLRAGLARPPHGPTFRLVPPFEEHRDGTWIAAGWARLASLIAGELELSTGRANPEFVPQVEDGHRALAAVLAARARTEAGDDAFVESEQSLVFGHRFHPSPKARQGTPAEWLPYAPEARARFRPRWLAVPEPLLAEEGDPAAFAALEPFAAPPGHRLLPAHPWQLDLLRDDPLLRRAFADGLVRDLGPGPSDAHPTSSVRTVYLPDADAFLKFGLDVRITNCVRKNAWYELSGAVALDRMLRPVFAALGATLLAEPAYRTVALAGRRVYEGLGVIVRQGVRGLPGRPLLAAALTAPALTAPGLTAPGLTSPGLAGASAAPVAPVALAGLAAVRSEPLAWWDAYLSQVVPPVLRAFLEYGVVLEPHLQNVLVCVDDDGMPVRAAFRDLEGTKLVAGRWDLGHLPARVREAVTYDEHRGWDRVVYCLVVNHLAEVAAALADLRSDRDSGFEARLWRAARPYFAGGDPRLRALLAGVPVPAKANLRTRWSRSADRAAGYVPVANPLRVESRE